MEKQAPLQLDHYVVNVLNIAWINTLEDQEKRLPESGEYDTKTRLQLFHSKDDELNVALSLTVEIEPPETESGITRGYKILAEMFGVFRVGEQVKDENKGFVTHVNTATILYGILRGVISQSTGIFPAGSFSIPTLNMANEWQKQKERDAERETER